MGSDRAGNAASLVREPFLTLKPYVPGKPISETERELGISGVVKLASNENPLGPSPLAQKAVADAVAGLNDYPDGGTYALKQALSAYHSDARRQKSASPYRIAPEQILLGNGTNEIIEMVIRTVVRPGEHMIYTPGTFIAYKLCALAAGVPLVEVPLAKMGYDLDAILAAVTPKTKLVFIANPNNPTGSWISKAAWDRFIQALPSHVVLVLDEAYVEYVRKPDHADGPAYLGMRERLLVTRTFSKCFGLAGLRCGYALGSQELIDFLNRGRAPFNVNSLAQVGALAALADSDHRARTVAENTTQITILTDALTQMGAWVAPSQANFLWVDLKTPAAPVVEGLLHAGIIVRPMAGYGWPHAIRLTVGTHEQNQRFLSALAKVWQP